ncbi:hypothetical protein ppKF707_0548 [Metapseudomonas furukawaii]|uniref:Uncharacterized protein n=2 Tax=Metapseudomonas furukawaii TaxID=1149133 RepID=A0AAD1BXP6_METFU|nr:hypothetical protein ppKF707_0548 [Pseudomonas furukawaii]BAU73085.1 hypothetical protein KF707C_13970 [Pseudomonas furukawaii]
MDGRTYYDPVQNEQALMQLSDSAVIYSRPAMTSESALHA